MWVDEKLKKNMKIVWSKVEPFHKIDDLKKIESKRKRRAWKNFLESGRK